MEVYNKITIVSDSVLQPKSRFFTQNRGGDLLRNLPQIGVENYISVGWWWGAGEGVVEGGKVEPPG